MRCISWVYDDTRNRDNWTLRQILCAIREAITEYLGFPNNYSPEYIYIDFDFDIFFYFSFF